MTALGLTRREREALDFIVAYIREHRVPPSYGEIAIGLDLKSKSGVTRLVVGLEERGHIARLPGRGRSISLIEPASVPSQGPTLPPKIQALLDRYCSEHGETPEAIMADAINLFIDEMGERIAYDRR